MATPYPIAAADVIFEARGGARPTHRPAAAPALAGTSRGWQKNAGFREAPVKIADVSELYAERGGGIRTYTLQKLAAAAAAGHELTVIAPGPRDEIEARNGGHIAWVKSRPLPLDPRYYLLLRERAVHRLLDQIDPDIIEGSSPWQGAWFASRWRGDAARTIIFHSDPVAIYGQTFLDRFLGERRVNRLATPYWRYLSRMSKGFDATICSGTWLAEKVGDFGMKAPIAVPFGIDKDCFSPDRRDPEVRRKLLALCGLDEDAPLLVNVSRMHPEKRLGTVFRAVQAVRKDRPVGLVVYGHGPFEPIYARIARQNPGVHLAGFTKDRDELATVLASADAMIHGSASETYGLVIAEALCSGLPLIVPDRGGAGDLAAPAYSETYAPGDHRGAAAALHRLLDRDPAALRGAAADAGQNRVGTMDDHFKGLFAVYEALIAKRGRA